MPDIINNKTKPVANPKLTCQTDSLYSHTDYFENGEAIHWSGIIEYLPNRFQKFKLQKGGICEAHYHVNVEFTYIMEGSAVYTIDQKEYAAGAGDFVVFNSKQMHAAVYTDDIVFIHMILDPGFTDDFGVPIVDIIFKNIIRSRPVQEISEGITQEIETQPMLYEHRIRALLQILVVELIRSHTRDMENLSETGSFAGIMLVKKIIHYLSKNFDHKITLDEIAEEVCFNKSYIARTFKRITKHTIWEYLNLMRCRYANQMLTQTNDSVEEIAHLCGFGNVSYFGKVYKEYMNGLTPTEYRSRHSGRQGNGDVL